MCDVTPCTSSDKQRSVEARKYRFDNNKWNLTTHRHHHGFRSRKKVNSQFHFHADTADFIHKIENIKPPADCWLCSFDISQIFTNCPINEILSAVRIAYDDFDKANFKIKNKKNRKTFFYGRYSDDGFMIYNGNINQWHPWFFNMANNHHRFFFNLRMQFHKLLSQNLM